MISVAVVGLLFATKNKLERRSHVFHQLCLMHNDEMWRYRPGLEKRQGSERIRYAKMVYYYLELNQKYRRACRYPWLPVSSDPPRPPEP